MRIGTVELQSVNSDCYPVTAAANRLSESVPLNAPAVTDQSLARSRLTVIYSAIFKFAHLKQVSLMVKRNLKATVVLTLIFISVPYFGVDSATKLSPLVVPQSCPASFERLL